LRRRSCWAEFRLDVNAAERRRSRHQKINGGEWRRTRWRFDDQTTAVNGGNSPTGELDGSGARHHSEDAIDRRCVRGVEARIVDQRADEEATDRGGLARHIDDPKPAAVTTAFGGRGEDHLEDGIFVAEPIGERGEVGHGPWMHAGELREETMTKPRAGERVIIV
jgi:hypothetical protein